MLQFYGQINLGKDCRPQGAPQYGLMNTDQVKCMLLRRYPYRPTKDFESSLTTCINHVLSDAGTATGKYKFQNETIYHTSSGAGLNKGCTLFYVKRAQDIAAVVGIGYHVGQQSYDILWVRGRWARVNEKITLD